ncbi:hypothetical protein AJ80_08051 [Polytolypa hystricis UAMH7299]|uniref:Deacetylase complex subunit Sds3 n=1 Tax=Polytolypa hystricis (strain UAMH7299) TaxID=1447883 RepID=A0A2B7XED9_POLH7|nr:hypothetical protein AJ80_08051 [Polytolypa hystricis UAMH7299]
MAATSTRNRSLSPATAATAVANPQPAPPLSKRDKRRSALQERLHDLTETFNNNRDYHFRQQLHSLQNEMALIANSQVYGTEPIPDTAEDIAGLVQQLAATGHLVPEALPTGRWYAKFVQEVNQTKEERDTELAVLMNRHRDSLARLKRERDFRTQFAVEEYHKLGDTLRERLVQSISQRKNRLMREKEQLDIADTNALLLHPNQFSITNPASPGGLQSNRKTRHTRHRVDIDEMGNGIGAEPSGKRKRKAPIDDEFGSPARDGLSTPADKAKARNTQQQNAAAYHISSLFTEKELAMHSNSAHVAAVHFLAASKRAKLLAPTPASNGPNTDAEEASGPGDGSGMEDGAAGAVEMERTTSQGFHATRSTRTNGTSGLNLLGELADKAASRPNLPYFILGNYHARPNGSGSAPPPPPLMPDEVEEDLTKIDRLSKKPANWMDTKLVGELMETILDQELEDIPAGTSTMRFGSMLHPDFPPQMDVHLVPLYPRNDTTA